MAARNRSWHAANATGTWEFALIEWHAGDVLRGVKIVGVEERQGEHHRLVHGIEFDLESVSCLVGLLGCWVEALDLNWTD